MRLLIVLICFFTTLFSAGAHDLYVGLTDASGRPCCTLDDCRPAHYRLSQSGVHMEVDGKWIWVAPLRIQYLALRGDTGETGGGHWCARASDEDPEILGGFGTPQDDLGDVAYGFSSAISFISTRR